MGNKLTITISGAANSGQTELAGRIAQLLEYLDIPVTFDNPSNIENASAATQDNWQSELSTLAPEVHIVEVVQTEDLHAKKRRAFLEHLHKSSAAVATWPDWKKGGFGNPCGEIDHPDECVEEPSSKIHSNRIIAELKRMQAAMKKE